MTAMALPCIVCKKPLYNVYEDADNQPADGVVFKTYGNYGSEVFDPMNGNFLEIVVCDECLVESGAMGRVYTARDRRQVVMDGVLVGHEEVEPILVEWSKNLPTLDDRLNIGPEDFAALPKNVHLNIHRNQ